MQHLKQGEARHNVRGCAADELSHLGEELQVVIGSKEVPRGWFPSC